MTGAERGSGRDIAGIWYDSLPVGGLNLYRRISAGGPAKGKRGQRTCAAGLAAGWPAGRVW